MFVDARSENSGIAKWLAYLHTDTAALGLIPEIVSVEKIVSLAEANQRHFLEESGQWLENVD